MIPSFDPITLGGIIASAGASYGITAYKAKTVATRLEKHESDDTKFHTETIDRLARIETKLDALIEK
jgi:hypothetical protein